MEDSEPPSPPPSQQLLLLSKTVGKEEKVKKVKVKNDRPALLLFGVVHHFKSSSTTTTIKTTTTTTKAKRKNNDSTSSSLLKKKRKCDEKNGTERACRPRLESDDDKEQLKQQQQEQQPEKEKAEKKSAGRKLEPGLFYPSVRPPSHLLDSEWEIVIQDKNANKIKNEALLQYSRYHYMLGENSKRIRLDDGMTQEEKKTLSLSLSLCSSSIFQREILMELPPFLTMDCWLRHQYSLQDVKSTLKYYSTSDCWSICLLYKQTCATNAIKVSFSNEEDTICNAKATAINTICNTLVQLKKDWPQDSALTYVDCRHKPRLPVHHISHNLYQKLAKMLNYSSSSIDSGSSSSSGGSGSSDSSGSNSSSRQNKNNFERSYNCSFVWRNIEVVPWLIEKPNVIQMMRIVSKIEYEQRLKKPACQVEKPLFFNVRNKEYCSALEHFYVYSSW